MNPVIKFTTLFGLLAVELGVQLAGQYGSQVSHLLSGLCLAGSALFVWRSFYGMRIVRQQ
jgi:K(+)-stimulated pyrophosphate-energized sodium pump